MFINTDASSHVITFEQNGFTSNADGGAGGSPFETSNARGTHAVLTLDLGSLRETFEVTEQESL